MIGDHDSGGSRFEHPLDRNLARLLRHAYTPMAAGADLRARVLQAVTTAATRRLQRRTLLLARLPAAAILLLSLAVATLLAWPRPGGEDLPSSGFVTAEGVALIPGARVQVARTASVPVRLRSQTGALLELAPGSQLQILQPDAPPAATPSAHVRAGHLRCVTLARASGPVEGDPSGGNPAIRLFVGGSRILPEAVACEFEVLLASDADDRSPEDLWFLDPDKLRDGAVAIVVHSGRLSFDDAGIEVELAGGEALLRGPGASGSERFSWRDPRGAKTPAILSQELLRPDARTDGRTEAGGTIRGRVQAQGTPVAHALVELVAVGAQDDAFGPPPKNGPTPTEAPMRRAAARTFRSADDGTFAFRGLPPGRYYLRVSDGVHAQLHDEVQALEAGRLVIERSLDLRPGFVLQGMVARAPDGLPLAEARVCLVARTAGSGLRDALVATTARDGHFHVRGVASGRYRLIASAPGHASREVEGLAAESEFQRIELPPLQVLRGRVVRAADQRPVTAFSLVVENLDDPEAMAPIARQHVVDPEGLFDVPDMPPGRYRVHALAEANTRGDAGASWAAGERAPELLLELGDGTRVHGRVLDAFTGAPIPDARVWCEQDFPAMSCAEDLQSEFWRGLRTHVVMTDVFGRFALDHVRPGPVHLAASHPDFAMARAALTAPRAARSEIELRLPSGGSFAGRVGPSNRSRQWRIWIEPRDPGRPQGLFGKHRTDALADGTWRVDRVAPGAYTLICTPADPGALEDVDIRFAVVEPGRTTTVEFNTPSAGSSLRVEFVDPQGRPQPNLTIFCMPRHGLGENRCRISDPDGVVTFRGLAPGELTGVYLDVPTEAGVVLLGHARMLAGPEPTRLRVVLGATSLSGLVVRRSDAAPVPGTQVHLFARNPFGTEPRFVWAGRIAGGPAGRYEFRSLPPGEYYASGQGDGLGHELTPAVNLAFGQHAQLAALRLGAAGAARFRVLDRAGRPVDGATVQVLDESQRRIGVAPFSLTIQGGTLTATGVRPGSYTASAAFRGHATAEVPFQVREGETADVVLQEP